MHGGGIFCALAKAFDCVNHEIVLGKLHFFGIQGISVDWFKSFLTNRRQKVEVNLPSATQNVFSDWGTLKHEVPLRSIPGPLLFIIHIKDFPMRINDISEPILFADDTSLIISSRNFEDICSVSNLVLFHMIKCFAANNLVLNLDKLNIMKLKTKNSEHSTLHIGYKKSI